MPWRKGLRKALGILCGFNDNAYLEAECICLAEKCGNVVLAAGPKKWHYWQMALGFYKPLTAGAVVTQKPNGLQKGQGSSLVLTAVFQAVVGEMPCSLS